MLLFLTEVQGGTLPGPPPHMLVRTRLDNVKITGTKSNHLVYSELMDSGLRIH